MFPYPLNYASELTIIKKRYLLVFNYIVVHVAKCKCVSKKSGMRTSVLEIIFISDS